MDKLYENAILRSAIDKYGAELQEEMAIEECAELIIAIRHKHRGREHNIAEEIADVEIMLGQLKMINNCEADVEKLKREKLSRLARRMDDEKDLC